MISLAQDRNADKVLVDMLCVAYAKELKAYHGYLHAYVTVTGPLESVYGEIYESFMKREMHHLEELGKKIVAMGGMPPIEYPSIEKVAAAIYKGYDATLAILQDAEVETLEMYKKIHEAADKAGDLPLVLLVEEIMQEEEEHHDELQRILMDVPGKDNVEKHDELVVDAFAMRRQKLADLTALPEVKNEADMNKYAIRWFKVNKEIVKLLNQMGINEDDVGVIDYDDEAYPQLLRDLMKQRDILQSKLGDFDMKWLVRYMEDGSDEGKKADDAFAARKVKLAWLLDAPDEDKFVMRQSKIATLFYDELLKLKDERRKVTEEIEKIIADLKQDPNFGTENMAPRPEGEGDRLDRLGKREWQLRQQIMELEKAKRPDVMSDKRDITDANMNSYIKKWIKLNKEMRDMEDEFGIEDEDDYSAPTEYKRLVRERKEIKQALDDFDDNWMRDYFGAEEPMDEVEPVMTMRDYK